MNGWVRLTVVGCCVAGALAAAACVSRPEKSTSGNDATAQATQALGPRIARAAIDLLGTPYRYGGESVSEGFDCSGLVQFVHARHGIAVPRTSAAQYRSGSAIDELQPGDAIYFRIGGRISHTGIYLGDGRFVHAPSSGRQVSIARTDQPYYRRRFAGARRFH